MLIFPNIQTKLFDAKLVFQYGHLADFISRYWNSRNEYGPLLFTLKLSFKLIGCILTVCLLDPCFFGIY